MTSYNHSHLPNKHYSWLPNKYGVWTHFFSCLFRFPFFHGWVNGELKETVVLCLEDWKFLPLMRINILTIVQFLLWWRGMKGILLRRVGAYVKLFCFWKNRQPSLSQLTFLCHNVWYTWNWGRNLLSNLKTLVSVPSNKQVAVLDITLKLFQFWFRFQLYHCMSRARRLWF